MRAMPSPTSMTVPTSLTSSRCSKPAISRFNTLVISATLMAICFSGFRVPSFGSRVGSRTPRNPRPGTRNPSKSLLRGDDHPLTQRRELRADRRVDQFVLHADHQAADDVFVDVLVDDRVLLQGLR